MGVSSELESTPDSWITGAFVSKLPPWLRSGSNESCWYFKEEQKGYAPSHYTVTWALDGARRDGHDPHERYWREVGQQAVVAYASSLDSSQKRITSIVNFARVVRPFVAWACWERRCSSISQFSKNDLKAYEKYIKSLGLKMSSVEMRLGVLRTIGLLGDQLSESMPFVPYRWRGELKKVAKSIGKPNGRTRTLDPECFFRLLDHALGVLESGEEWVALGEKYAQFRDEVSRPSRKVNQLGVDANEILARNREVYGSCIVIVLSLLSPRKHEVASFEVGDARRVIEKDDGILVGRLTKSSNGSGGTRTERPTVPALRKAVKLVLRIVGSSGSDDARPLFRISILDAYRTQRKSDPLDTGQIYRLIEYVAKCAGVTISVRPHMFRRAFSMIYVWRYEFGDLAHLSRFLCHNDLKQTLAYVEGDDIRQFMSDAERELGRSLMERALVGKETFGGGFGAWLESFARRLRARVTVIRPEHVDHWIQARIAEGGFSIAPGPHGYCVTFRDRGGRAACSTDGKRPDFRNRTDQHCARCCNFLLTDRSVQYWESSLEAHERTYKSSRIKVVKQVAAEAIAAAKRMLASFRARS